MVAAQADDLIERAMCEIVSQRQLFRQSQQRKIKRLSPEGGKKVPGVFSDSQVLPKLPYLFDKRGLSRL